MTPAIESAVSFHVNEAQDWMRTLDELDADAFENVGDLYRASLSYSTAAQAHAQIAMMLMRASGSEFEAIVEATVRAG